MESGVITEGVSRERVGRLAARVQCELLRMQWGMEEGIQEGLGMHPGHAMLGEDFLDVLAGELVNVGICRQGERDNEVVGAVSSRGEGRGSRDEVMLHSVRRQCEVGARAASMAVCGRDGARGRTFLAGF